MSASDVQDLISFLKDGRYDLRKPALNALLPFTVKSSPRRLLLQTRPTISRLAELARAEDPTEAHDAIKALINLAESEAVAKQLGVDEPGLLKWLVQRLSDPTCVLADPLAMLLSNITKNGSCANALLSLSPDILALICDIFVSGEGKHANPNASYDFLASVLANLASMPAGRRAMIKPEKGDMAKAPVAKIATFTEHSNLIRRGGTISAIKNCCFAREAVDDLVDPDKANLLPRLLLPMCGADEFDAEDLLTLPDDLASLPPEKKREADPALRLMIVEALLLLCGTRSARQRVRDLNVYRVIQKADLAEHNEDVKSAIDRLVNVLHGDEPATLEPAQDDEDEDLAVTEV